jgi:hypothetical protein
MAFAKFMAGPIGRIARISVGILLIVVGMQSMQGIGSLVVTAIGAVFIAVGLMNVCLIAPLIGAPFHGSKTLQS